MVQTTHLRAMCITSEDFHGANSISNYICVAQLHPKHTHTQNASSSFASVEGKAECCALTTTMPS